MWKHKCPIQYLKNWQQATAKTGQEYTYKYMYRDMKKVTTLKISKYLYDKDNNYTG